MAEILPFRRPKASAKHRGKSLCRHGHHKWEIEREHVFDVKQGRLITRYVCSRCGMVRVRPQ